MTLTKIPPAVTQEEVSDHIVTDMDRSHRYDVEDAGTGRVLATDLSKRQAMEFTWLHDGRDYKIERRMGFLHDAHGQTGIRHQLSDVFGSEWDVYFKAGHGHAWRYSRLTAYGADERLALLDLIDQGFSRSAWSDEFHVQRSGVTNMRKFLEQVAPKIAASTSVAA